MMFTTFTGLSEKSSRKALAEKSDREEFLANLKEFLDIKTESEFDLKLKDIFSDKERCTLFCKKLGYTKEEFIKLLVENEVEFMFQPRNASWIRRIHYKTKKA